ncbi:hypothetical protein Pla108_22360 [Botrimarina colliarenosi]|uniref:Uncharacterized protein n=1 Tax=Botrimarina colliarenosi TaxID=2528001 RepID=A0A5C6AEP3_9BACT|nr:hypothetical protein [Botrimarina colliarenosi]TWT98079.1 hypothetical protein Pla108_22360 [Botrimarina colliarenosi]
MSYVKKQRRRGSVYLAVMGATMIVATIALATAGIGRLTLRNAADQQNRRQAQLAARSGIEYALQWLNSHADWRSTLTSGVDSAELSAGNLRFTWRVTDVDDGALADNARDNAVVRAVGIAGSTRSVLEVEVEPAGHGLSCLASAMHAANYVAVGSPATISRNGEITADDIGSPYGAAQVRENPASDYVFDYYLQRGTPIAIDSLPTYYGKRYFSYRVLSRSVNPFGETNPWGIYWIDCQGQTIDLYSSRVVGTLVLINPGWNSVISNVMVMQPQAPNQPSLMVRGDLQIDLYSNGLPWLGIPSSSQLKESGSVNYNPAGAPYNGVSDNDVWDEYPATLDGLVYISGTATISDDTVIRGNLVAGNVVVNSNKNLHLEHRPYALNYPPPGFSAGDGVRVLPGTWRHVGM